ncbi:MAG: DNA-3-methyladenine glycosylase 2 family protein [Syntrophomonadaceae bacterium]
MTKLPTHFGRNKESFIMGESKSVISFSIDSQEVTYLTQNDSALRHVVDKIGDLMYTLHMDSFSFMVDTIIGQMLSSKVADVISDRMHSLCGGDVSPQTVAGLSLQNLRGIGLSNAKAQYIFDLSNYVLRRPGFFTELQQLSDEELVKEIMRLRGLGVWSAKMYLIFVLNKLDVLPYEDSAFRQAYSWLYSTSDLSNKAIEEKCAMWKPYSSIAARYLYRALDSGLTQTRSPSLPD